MTGLIIENLCNFDNDGRLILLKSNLLKIYNPSSGVTENYSLQTSYDWYDVEGDYIYARNTSQGLQTYQIDISDLNNIQETLVIDNPTDGSAWTYYGSSVENGNILYNVYNSGAFNNSSDSRYVFKKSLGSDPEIIYQGWHVLLCPYII